LADRIAERPGCSSTSPHRLGSALIPQVYDRRPVGTEEPERDMEDEALVAAVRAGDEAAFGRVVDTYYALMLRVAREYVSTKEAAEDVVQETFLGVIQGIDRFEQRSSLRTWMFRILVNRAKTRGEREGRSRPFSSLTAEVEADDPGVQTDRFLNEGRWAGFWNIPPSPRELPEASVLADEVGDRLIEAIQSLPPAQRTVIELRDIQGCTPAEVCQLLDISEANQRVLLHRARSKARARLEHYLDERASVP
jgi:RNA polymerase sigma-70 factor (ECF subfamily)